MGNYDWKKADYEVVIVGDDSSSGGNGIEIYRVTLTELPIAEGAEFADLVSDKTLGEILAAIESNKIIEFYSNIGGETHEILLGYAIGVSNIYSFTRYSGNLYGVNESDPISTIYPEDTDP